ncbi:MAG: hypothetical protein JWR69_2787 [Pedosphaera sp.]|nr:hypothetical protein [Pedosphaera sp.]
MGRPVSGWVGGTLSKNDQCTMGQVFEGRQFGFAVNPSESNLIHVAKQGNFRFEISKEAGTEAWIGSIKADRAVWPGGEVRVSGVLAQGRGVKSKLIRVIQKLLFGVKLTRGGLAELNRQFVFSRRGNRVRVCPLVLRYG